MLILFQLQQKTRLLDPGRNLHTNYVSVVLVFQLPLDYNFNLRIGLEDGQGGRIFVTVTGFYGALDTRGTCVRVLERKGHINPSNVSMDNRRQFGARHAWQKKIS